MIPEDTLNGSSLASHYDSKAEEYNWRGPEVVFGLSYSFVNPGESVLDIGIGTGLGSALFHKAGLHVYGMDVSTEMLDACRSKGFATDLKKHDLGSTPVVFLCLTVVMACQRRTIQCVFRDHISSCSFFCI